MDTLRHQTATWTCTVPEDEIDKNAAKSLPQADTILFGRKTYDNFEIVLAQCTERGSHFARPPREAGMSPALREMAVWINEANKLVFSRPEGSHLEKFAGCSGSSIRARSRRSKGSPARRS